MNNNFNYKGIVNISIVDKKGKVMCTTKHNSGTSLISQIFTRSLLSQDISDLKPAKIDIQKKLNTQGAKWNSILSYKSDITGLRSGIDTNNWFFPKFETLIMPQQMSQYTKEASETLKLVLLTESGNVIAESILTNFEIAKNKTMVIAWEMHITNSNN